MKLLVIEDEERIASALKKGLEQENFTVDVTNDGETGYDLAISEDYDLIILDLMLPLKSGTEICRDLRAEKKTMPILMLTAKGQLQDKVEGLQIGADDYLTKPFAFEELLARIRALLRRPAKLAEKIIKIGQLEINLADYKVMCGKKEIKISKNEFRLLEYLAINMGKTVSKEQIMAKVWDFDKDVLPNTVEVYIKNLRHKLDLSCVGMGKVIKTIRGFGYRLEA